MVWYGTILHDRVWSGIARYGMVWNGMVCRDMQRRVWCGMEIVLNSTVRRHGTVLVWYGTILHDNTWYGMARYYTTGCGMVWYGMI